MQLHLHPTRHEALTASDTALTRWSLDTNPAAILAQWSVAPGELFSRSFDPGGRLQHLGGVTLSADGRLVALEHPLSRATFAADLVLEWHSWEDFSLARTSALSEAYSELVSLASSPDGRWLVLSPSYPARIFLLGWQTGEIMSHHAVGGYRTPELAFDPTSTFVAGFACGDSWGHCMLWRLDPAERVRARPPGEQWWSDGPPDEISGSMALSMVHWALDRTNMEWPDGDLADTACQAAFSPDSRIVIFNLMRGGHGLELVAYEVISGKRLWWARRKEENAGPFILTPDGSTLFVPVQGGDLLVYRVEDGTLMQQMPSNLDESVQALAFDRDGTTLWFATEGQLVQYQSQS